MAKEISSIDFRRARFEKINEYYGKKQGLAPQLSIIRIEEELKDGKGTYTFDLKKRSLSASEKDLKRNDLFVVNKLGLALLIEDEDKPGITVPMFDAEKAVFTTSGSAVTIDKYGFKTEDIKALYNGSLYIATGTTVNFADLPCGLFLRSHGYNAGSALEERNGRFNLEDCLCSMAEELVLAGTQDHTITVTFPTFPTSDYSALQGKDANGDVNTHIVSKIVFIAEGYRVVGGTLEKYKEKGNPYADCI